MRVSIDNRPRKKRPRSQPNRSEIRFGFCINLLSDRLSPFGDNCYLIDPVREINVPKMGGLLSGQIPVPLVTILAKGLERNL